MASAAQIEANRLGAALSSAPKLPMVRPALPHNHLKFSLFATENCVRAEETAEYTRLSKAPWKTSTLSAPSSRCWSSKLCAPPGALHRCAVREAEDGANPPTQASVDRDRASAHNSIRRLLNDLRQFQSDRWLRAEVLREGFHEAHCGIPHAHPRYQRLS